MQLHLVGGFLGSGKTTAIMAAAHELITRHKTVGIITNDQGKYLVDTAFFKHSTIPTVEVTGGCFCCNYNDLDTRLDELIDLVHPDVIFAESVGSCTDLVATVIKPMLSLRSGYLNPKSFSVFVDSRMLRLHLMGESLPFADNVIYIFRKQIEEAALVIINKADLLSEEKKDEVADLFRQIYPQKEFLFQNSLAANGTNEWLQKISNSNGCLPVHSLEIDYQRYGAGESQLAWLDEEWMIQVEDGTSRSVITQLLERVVTALRQQAIPIGHLKFLVSDGNIQTKISLTTIETPDWLAELPQLSGTQINLLINGRVQMDPNEFRNLIDNVFRSNEVISEVVHSNAFHPGQPQPTFRFG
jgi:G3E family GTPase